MKNLFKNVRTGVSLTLDGWTSSTQHPFMGATAHYIDADWNLREVLLDYMPIVGEHSGANLSHFLIGMLRDFDVLEQVFAIVTDSASNNDTMFACFHETIQKCMTATS
eukprot:TRINITY_DN10762_c0_g1_i1.p1 TRINITY_DN10762_c0_g1~~TRINITY_DN10762_c0_g1_i1.p1  ORF type:complete len:108 (-),score=4.94 TRINITY_DN10762_c0_g1_i1:60-383(-)